MLQSVAYRNGDGYRDRQTTFVVEVREYVTRLGLPQWTMEHAGLGIWSTGGKYDDPAHDGWAQLFYSGGGFDDPLIAEHPLIEEAVAALRKVCRVGAPRAYPNKSYSYIPLWPAD